MDAKTLKEHFDYDPVSGVITRLSTGAPTGSRNGNNYLCLRIAGKTYQAHRMAVALMTGSWPPRSMVVDHRNGDRMDNRWTNLRVITQSQNLLNRRLGINNKSGRKGVCWNKASKGWEVGFKRGGKKFHVGIFDDLDEAAEAYQAASKAFADMKAVHDLSRNGFDLGSTWKALRLEKSLTC